MRWEKLFADFDAQAIAEDEAEFRAEVQDRTRAERAGIDLAARLQGALGHQISVTLIDGTTVHGPLVDAAAQWLLIGELGPQRLVPAAAIAHISGLPQRAGEVGVVTRKLGIGHVLRALARDRTRVVARTMGGQIVGLIGAVGADYVELSAGVGASVVVPLGGLVEVHSIQ